LLKLMEHQSQHQTNHSSSLKPKASGLPFFQPKLTVNQPNDVYEQEADAMADQVMRMLNPAVNDNVFFKPAPAIIQRKCQHCEEEEKVQRKENSGEQVYSSTSLDSYVSTLRSSGQTLSASSRQFFEPRFGHDFSNVRLHTDSVAAKSAQSINALAYTTGNNIVFNSGQYSPDSDSGKKLMAHELTHVVQQQGNIQPKLIQRQEIGNDFVDVRDGAPHASTCGAPSHCPASFCQPFPSENLARQQRDRMMPVLLAGIAIFVNSRVVPLWAEYLMGGSPTKNLTADFGADFAASPTTASTTRFLAGALRRSLEATPPTFPAGSNVVTIDIASRISSEIAAITTSGDLNEMNFNIPSDIAGNLAGGIGDNQTTCRSGAQPSPFNDARIVTGTATITKDALNNLTVSVSLSYTVKDTIDLCPGDCGTSREQIATVPMSQFEATGIAGDVPFIIDFTASSSFVIPHP
jgi:hypothetical protein